MQNEFEKQVQQKMEELKLVPSDPVWQKVEMQIRRKKDRRRVIFWIPLLFLLGGGLWLGIDQYSNKISYSKGNEKIQKQNPLVTPESTNKVIEENNQTLVHLNKSENQRPSDISGTKSERLTLNSTAVEKSFFKKVKKGKEISFVEGKDLPLKAEDIIETDVSNEKPQVQPNVNVSDTGLKAIPQTDTVRTIKEKTQINTISESVKRDSASIEKPEIKKHVSSKWKYNLVVAAGTSGLGRINVYNGQKSLSYSPNTNGGSGMGGSPSSNGPSEVEKGFAFMAGTVVKKQVGKRSFFSTGLQYNYYSNSIEVGSRINQNRVIMDYAVSQFYSNQGTVLKPYKNQYHFISLPAVFEWQLLKKHPLNFSTGFSFQYLVHTNALRFDYTTQSYFHDIDAFNRAQLLSEFGLNYSVSLKQKPLAFGPQLQYGLTRLEKGNSDHHLFSYGLRAQWQLHK